MTLAGQVAERSGLQLSCVTLRRTLLARDVRWRRRRHELPPDPTAASIMWDLGDRRLHLPAEAVVLALDECEGHLLPVLRVMGMPTGWQVRIHTPGTNRKRSVFGALSLTGGRWHHQVSARKRAVEFLAFLEQLSRASPDQLLRLVLDSASIHKAKLVQAWLGDHPQVHLLYLPAYSGHEQNPVEKVWWRLKDRVAAAIPDCLGRGDD